MRLGKARPANLSQSRAIGHDIYVREADDWKIRVSFWNTTPDSVILIQPEFCTTTGRNAVPDRQP